MDRQAVRVEMKAVVDEFMGVDEKADEDVGIVDMNGGGGGSGDVDIVVGDAIAC